MNSWEFWGEMYNLMRELDEMVDGELALGLARKLDKEILALTPEEKMPIPSVYLKAFGEEENAE